MAHELTPPPSFSSLVRSNTLSLFLDFDGTLVEIADRPHAIEVRPGLDRDLREVASKVAGRLAIISGRSRADIASHLDVSGLTTAGSHGAALHDGEGKPFGPAPSPFPNQARERLEQEGASSGLWIERKPHGAAIHYRTDPTKEEQARKIANGIARDFGLLVKPGKCVFELVLPGVNKGAAVDILLSEPRFAGSTPIFVGDDFTDEDAFAACRRHGGWGILVGSRRNTEATYRLLGVKQLHDWLELKEQ